MQHILQKITLNKTLIALAVVSFGAVAFFVVANLTKPADPVASTLPQAQQAQVAPIVGTTASIDSLTTQDATTEAGINASFDQVDQASVDSTSQDAVTVEGAYDESTF